VGASTDAALEEVLAARSSLAEETDRLKASAKNAVDIKGKVKRNPRRAAGVAAGTAFVLVGGPKRVLRGVKHRIVGKPDPLPPSLLPSEIDKAVRALGDDGAKVRGALERSFAEYLDVTVPARKKAARRDVISSMGKSVFLSSVTPVAARAVRQAYDKATGTTSPESAPPAAAQASSRPAPSKPAASTPKK
jgi:hypothetical protein